MTLVLWLFTDSLGFKRGSNLAFYCFYTLFLVCLERWICESCYFVYCHLTEDLTPLDQDCSGVSEGFRCHLALTLPWDMTQMTCPMMTMVAARKIFLSWNSSRLWVTVLLLLVVNPVFSGKYHPVSFFKFFKRLFAKKVCTTCTRYKNCSLNQFQ